MAANLQNRVLCRFARRQMMADRLTNIELLLMLCEDVKADNKDWSDQVFQEGSVRFKKVIGLLERIEQAKEALELERRWLSNYAPRIVQQDPQQRLANEPVQRKANS